MRDCTEIPHYAFVFLVALARGDWLLLRPSTYSSAPGKDSTSVTSTAMSPSGPGLWLDPEAWKEGGPEGKHRLKLRAGRGGDPGEADHVESPAQHVPQQGREAHVCGVVGEEAGALPVGDPWTADSEGWSWHNCWLVA